MMSVCMANGRWTPDHAEVVCIGKPGGIQCSQSYSASSDHSIACISSERLRPVCVCVCTCARACVS